MSYTIQKDDARPTRRPSRDLATALVIGELERGPGLPDPAPRKRQAIRDMRRLRQRFGPRTLKSQDTHDWVEKHLREGAGSARVFVIPARGPAAVKASVQLLDSSSAVAATLTFNEEGPYGNGFRFAVSTTGVTAGSFVLTVSHATDTSFVSFSTREIVDDIDLVAWAVSPAGHGLFTAAVGPGNDPAPTVVGTPRPMTGGDDNLAGITPTHLEALARRFGPAFGPALMVMPGRTSEAVHEAQANHSAWIATYGVSRIQKLQMPETTVLGDLLAHGALLRRHPAADELDRIYGTEVIPGLTSETERLSPGTALRAGCEARNDGRGVSPNQPAAADFGESQYSSGRILHEFTDPLAVQDLRDAGINYLSVVDGRVVVMGSRVAIDPADSPAGFRLGSARLRQLVIELTAFRLRRFEHREFESDGSTLAELETAMRIDLAPLRRSLYRLDVEALLVEGDIEGEVVLEVVTTLQVTSDGEVIRAVVRREVPDPSLLNTTLEA